MTKQNQRENKRERGNVDRAPRMPARPLSGWAEKRARDRLRDRQPWRVGGEKDQPADFGNAV